VAESCHLRYPHAARDLVTFTAQDDVWLTSLSEVAIAPHDWAAGRDPQLDTAIRLALGALERCPPAVPPAV
jgi:hypothetical protein